MQLDLEKQLQRLAAGQVDDEVPPEGEWAEWSPVPFGKAPAPVDDEPIEWPEEQRRAA